uniref:Uncharacterized protein n=1 Tax=virus sp. ctReX5 TaxID=2825818 RepID=A0A8S5RLV0_9VIRU|nr:MAG TPA: hypothetical protein [virus sp. ctReX5]DAU18660.1 MAG TPA: hypothetical protein [Caudoviricetes sp.]
MSVSSFLKLACRFFLFNFPSPFLTIVMKSVTIKSAILGNGCWW